MSNPYREIADKINAVPPGMCINISPFDIDNLPDPPWWTMGDRITYGWERVLEYVVGSSTGEWNFHEDFETGNMKCCRKRSEPDA